MALLRSIALLIVAILGVLGLSSGALAQKQVVGWIEKALVRPGDITLDAKLDTGAGNTSLDARIIGETNRNGRKVLKFVVEDGTGKSVTFEREQVGIEVVTSHSSGDEERPLVLLEICLGKDCRETVVNLANRAGLKYPLLIGRSYMLDFVVVDPDNQYKVQTQQKGTGVR
ncbi:MAG: RimK/LysX family protein [Thermodesulfobacteriota bacterium]